MTVSAPVAGGKVSRPKMIAVGGICATSVFRVPHVPPLPAKVIADTMVRLVDGMAVSAAYAFVRLGGTAAVWGRIGDDDAGRTMRAALAAEGLDTSGVIAVPGGRSSAATVIVDGQGRRLVVPFHDPSLACSPAALPLAELDTADIVHCDARWPDGAEHALRAARDRGIPTMLDGDVAPPGIIGRLLPLADYAVFSDAGILSHTGETDVRPALAVVARSHPGHVGASCGADGYVWLEGDSFQRVPAPRVEVVDTLAAGDVFHGAFALALVERRPIPEAAAFACTAASLKCRRFGGWTGCPTRSEVEAAGAAPATSAAPGHDAR